MTKLTGVDTVTQFITTFGASLDPRLWVTLIKEEFGELKEADTPENFLKEAIDLAYVIAGLFSVSDPEQLRTLLPAHEYAELDDLLGEVNRWTKANLGHLSDEVLDEAFDRVHASNMSKLDDDGKPIKREDGKILKGPNYKAPDLSDLV